MDGMDRLRRLRDDVLASFRSRYGLSVLHTSINASSPPSWKGIAVVLLLTFAVYIPTLRYQFVHDDRGQIVDNPAVHSWRFVPTYFTAQVWAGVMPGELGNYFRPLFLLWLRINHAAFGNRAWGWHLTTLLAHVLTTLLAYLLALGLGVCGDAALVAALVFGLHPAHIEAVAWISGATEPLLGVLLIASFISYVRWRRTGRRNGRLASVALFALALGEKETAMILPGLLLAYDWIFAGSRTWPSTDAYSESMRTACHSEHSEESRSAPGGSTNQDQGEIPRFARNDGLVQSSSAALRRIWPFVLVILLYLPARFYALKALSHAVTPLSKAQLALTWPSLICFWIRHLIWPVALSTFYDFPAVLHPTLRNFTFPLIIDVCIAAGLLAVARRGRIAAFSAAWLVLPLIPLLDLRVFVADDFAHDRYLYLPSVGFAILAGLGLKKLCAGGPRASRADLKVGVTEVVIPGIWGRASRWLGMPGALLAASLCLAAVLGYGTVTQSSYFRDNLTFYAYNSFMAPHNLAAESNYGTILAERGMYVPALAKFNDVLGSDPSYWPATYNLGLTHYKMGHLPEAEKYFLEAIRINPHKADEHFYLGMTLLKSGRTDEAIVSARRAIALNPTGFAYHFGLGVMLEAQGDFAGALREFKEELAVNPGQQAAAVQIKEIEKHLRETER
jgi:tetratricopeptide (TPR) repeat protein